MQFRKTIMLLMLFAPSAFAIEYTNSQYGVNFTLPDHWKVVNTEDLPLEKQQSLENKYHPFKTLSICGFRDDDGLDRSRIIIQFRKFETSTFDKAKRAIQTNYGQEMMISSAETNAEDALGNELKQYRIIESKSDFINSANRAYGIVHYESNNKPMVVAMEVKLLCNDGWVGLLCFSRGSEAERFVDIVNNIADSFQYNSITTMAEDEISEDITNISNEQKLESIWKWAGIILTISIVLGVLKMLFNR